MYQNRPINESDILNRDDYKVKRKSLREKMVLRKKNRVEVILVRSELE